MSFLVTWNEAFTFNEIFDSLVSKVNIYEILPFGIKYRYQLIEKWISFTDHENEKEKTNFLYEVEKLIKKLDELLNIPITDLVNNNTKTIAKKRFKKRTL